MCTVERFVGEMAITSASPCGGRTLRLSKTPGRKTMRDQLDMQAWADNHHQFDQWVADVGSALRRTGRLLDRVPPQLIAGAIAASVTLVTIGGAAA
jgi:hypothetical protein